MYLSIIKQGGNLRQFGDKVMGTVKFTDDNRTQVTAKGFVTESEAESAVDAFLSEQGDEYGREAFGVTHPAAEDGTFYFRVTTI